MGPARSVVAMPINTPATLRKRSASTTLPATITPSLYELPPLRRSRPGQVPTNFGSLLPSLAMLPSAVSTSSVTSGSLQGSPLMTPETAGTVVTTTSSLVPSPESLEPYRGRGLEDVDRTLPPLQLPDAVTSDLPPSSLSRRTSSNSLGHKSVKSPVSAMGETMRSVGIVRRTSNSIRNKAGEMFRRRPSSTHPSSRDTSVGPGVWRPPYGGNIPMSAEPADVWADSDTDADEKDETLSRFGGDGNTREPSLLSSTSTLAPSTSNLSAATAATAATAPRIPLALLNGTSIIKIGKRDARRTSLFIDGSSGKIWWTRRGNKTPKTVYIDNIKEIRTGEDIRQFRIDARLEEEVESRFFSINYTVANEKGNRTIKFLADDEETFRHWTQALDASCRHRQKFASSLMAFNDQAVEAYWQTEMRDKEEATIDFPGIERMCRNLHMHLSPQELGTKFDEVLGRMSALDPGLAATNRLHLRGFQEFVGLMKTRKDIGRIYHANAAKPEDGMTKDEFLAFLGNVQKENVEGAMAHWEGVFLRFARKGKPKDAERPAAGSEESMTMSESSFASFLTSSYNLAIHKEPQSYALDRPLNEYYISSSHNTYLIGRQVAGSSSTEGYIHALTRGCRCVEIDIWDGPKDEPIVVHGHTLTTAISFEEVIKTINRYAFVKSHFPLFISLEVRCSLKTQQTVRDMMVNTFGDKLVTEPINSNSDQLPSPSELMDRILIKVKSSNPPVEPSKNGERFGRRRGNSLTSSPRIIASESSSVPPSPLLGGSTPPSRSGRQINTINEGQVDAGLKDSDTSPAQSDSDSDSDKESPSKDSKINPVLGALGVYCVGIPFQGFDSAGAKMFNHIYSFKERTFGDNNTPGDSKRALYLHNMRHLMRVYPNGNRISSSNFDPLIYWKRGVQMAALNMQTYDLGMQLNDAMFASGTDQSGYVLKPKAGREIQVIECQVMPPPEKPGPEAVKVQDKCPRQTTKFSIDVISAQQLMRPWKLQERRTLDPCVQVEVFLADDKRNKPEPVDNSPTQHSQLKYHTKVVRENGFNPEFNAEHTFDVTTKYAELIFVRFSVRVADKGGFNEKAPAFATYTAKLSSLKSGYRTIPLLDHNGDRYLFSTLFCKITKSEIKDIMVNYTEDAHRNGNKLNRIGRTVFSPSNSNPKAGFDSNNA